MTHIMKHYQILIIGGGTAGITIAAQLKRKKSSLQIGIIEPSDKHYYQPAWTLVGAGAFDFKETERNEGDYIPNGVDWIKDKAISIDPDKNEVVTAITGTFTYDFLIPVPGLVMAPELLLHKTRWCFTPIRRYRATRFLFPLQILPVVHPTPR